MIKIKEIIYNFLIRVNYCLQILRIRKKYKKKEPIRVCFLVSEPSKWNSQYLYDALDTNELFFPFIVVTKLESSMNEVSFAKNLEIFKHYAHNVYIGYDINNHQSIGFGNFQPDIIFYQQPWELYKNQNVYYGSKFALTCYFSYAIEDSEVAMLQMKNDFYAWIYRYFVFSKSTLSELKNRYNYKYSNVVVSGHPKLDVYLGYNACDYRHEYVIYAPHHTIIDGVGNSYGTFMWSGHAMLEYAENHPNIKWVFKPHPKLKNMLLSTQAMTQAEIDDYYSRWGKVGIKYEEGNYFDLFKKSRCLITDCGSFLTEYLPTEQPVIHLRNTHSKKHTVTNCEIMECYYKCFTKETLLLLLDDIIVKGKDFMKEERLTEMKRLNINKSASKSIIDSILLNLI